MNTRSHDHPHYHEHDNLFHLHPMKSWQHYDHDVRTKFPPVFLILVDMIQRQSSSNSWEHEKGEQDVPLGFEGARSDSDDQEGVMTDGAESVKLMTSYLKTRVLKATQILPGRVLGGQCGNCRGPAVRGASRVTQWSLSAAPEPQTLPRGKHGPL